MSDLAPEITRFNQQGLVDDLGSMHHILRPETIESLFVLWRTSKRQIYRNWGQRMLCAFFRTKTPHLGCRRGSAKPKVWLCQP